MVTVIETAVRENGEGETYVALKLQAELEMIQSNKTGRFYATARTCWISSTFTEEVAETIVGSKMPGRVVKQVTEAYNYTVPQTGEVIELSHKWVYATEETPKPVPPRPSHTMRKAEPSLNGIEELV